MSIPLAFLCSVLAFYCSRLVLWFFDLDIRLQIVELKQQSDAQKIIGPASEDPEHQDHDDVL